MRKTILTTFTIKQYFVFIKYRPSENPRDLFKSEDENGRNEEERNTII